MVMFRNQLACFENEGLEVRPMKMMRVPCHSLEILELKLGSRG